jgi:hypothetical protein
MVYLRIAFLNATQQFRRHAWKLCRGGRRRIQAAENFPQCEIFQMPPPIEPALSRSVAPKTNNEVRVSTADIDDARLRRQPEPAQQLSEEVGSSWIPRPNVFGAQSGCPAYNHINADA